MKGHVGGGSMPGEFKAPVAWQAKSFHVLICNTHLYIVQERLLEMPASSSGLPGVVVGHQLESLILAQNERWRHA